MENSKPPRPEHGRPIADIITDLSKPLPERFIQTRKQGNADLSYIPWHTAVKFLELYAPGWSYSISSINQIDTMLVLVARIKVPCAEGLVYREATGFEQVSTKGYGDPASNAESMALRRAAAKFGLGLYLYDKK
jgi:hypothetical protein